MVCSTKVVCPQNLFSRKSQRHKDPAAAAHFVTEGAAELDTETCNSYLQYEQRRRPYIGKEFLSKLRFLFSWHVLNVA